MIDRLVIERRCACGRPLHYADRETQRFVEDLILQYGEFVSYTKGGRTWRVSRHYIALHPYVTGAKLAQHGFIEITAPADELALAQQGSR